MKALGLLEVRLILVHPFKSLFVVRCNLYFSKIFLYLRNYQLENLFTGENGYTTFTSDANYQYKFSGTQSNGGETWIEVRIISPKYNLGAIA